MTTTNTYRKSPVGATVLTIVALGFSGSAIVTGAAAAAAPTGDDPIDVWHQGRATFYGTEPWNGGIHKGSCGYGYLFKDEPLGWDIAAIPDAREDFAGSCGRCYEVKCVDETVADGYGSSLDRSAACFDPDASVVVRTVDTCPCNFKQNYYSNKRWCCGDVDHFDLSVWAFEKLADPKWGVMSMRYRAVPCDQAPAKPAPPVANPFPGMDPPSDAKRTNRWEKSRAGSAGAASMKEQVAAGTSDVYKGGEGAGWQAAHYNAQVQQADGTNAACGDVAAGGALAWQGSAGAYEGKISVELWVQCEDSLPALSVNIGGGEKTCNAVDMQHLNQGKQRDGWCQFDVYLGLFAEAASDEVVAFADSFKGCGGMAAGELDRLELKSTQGKMQRVCVNDIKLLG